MTPQRRAQTTALIALLKALPDQQLQDVLTGLDAHGLVVLDVPPERPKRPCGICGHPYPKCRRLWSEDHEYEAPDPIRKETNE